MSSGYTKGTPASSQIIWLEEKVKEKEENIDAIMQINARLRDEKREANAEIERLRAALRPFAKIADDYETLHDEDYVSVHRHDIELRHFRAIRSALQQKDSK